MRNLVPGNVEALGSSTIGRLLHDADRQLSETSQRVMHHLPLDAHLARTQLWIGTTLAATLLVCTYAVTYALFDVVGVLREHGR